MLDSVEVVAGFFGFDRWANHREEAAEEGQGILGSHTYVFTLSCIEPHAVGIVDHFPVENIAKDEKAHYFEEYQWRCPK